jgi:hypothetical protein
LKKREIELKEIEIKNKNELQIMQERIEKE